MALSLRMMAVLGPGLLLAETSGLAAQERLAGACSGVSLPRSVVTDILAPVAAGIADPIQSTINPLLAIVDTLTLGALPTALNIDVAGLVAAAAAGQPITLSVLDVDGNVIGPNELCIATADGLALDQQAGIAIGGNRVSGLGSNGAAAVAAHIDAIAFGNGARTGAGAADAIAIGRLAEVAAGASGAIAIGANAVASRANSVALGAGATTTAILTTPAWNPGIAPLAGAVAVGEVSVGSAGAERRITNVAAGAADTDAATVGQMRALDTKLADYAAWTLRYDSATRDAATLEGAAGTRISNVADGELSATSSDAVNGSQLYGTNAALARLAGVAVRYDTDAAGNRGNSVTLAGGDAASPVRVRNVAAGVDATDAVNVAQLEQGLAANRAQFDRQIAEARSEARQAAAVGLAAAALRFDARPGKLSAAIGSGIWRGETAMAFGVGYSSLSQNLLLSASAVTAGGNWGASAGLTLTLN